MSLEKNEEREGKERRKGRRGGREKKEKEKEKQSPNRGIRVSVPVSSGKGLFYSFGFSLKAKVGSDPDIPRREGAGELRGPRGTSG